MDRQAGRAHYSPKENSTSRRAIMRASVTTRAPGSDWRASMDKIPGDLLGCARFSSMRAGDWQVIRPISLIWREWEWVVFHRPIHFPGTPSASSVSICRPPATSVTPIHLETSRCATPHLTSIRPKRSEKRPIARNAVRWAMHISTPATPTTNYSGQSRLIRPLYGSTYGNV